MTTYEASVVSVRELSEPGICLSCTFFTDSTAEGCAVRLENDEHSFLFNTSRHNDEDLVLLECFPVQEEGVFNVTVYEIDDGEVQEESSRNLDDVEITAQNRGSEFAITYITFYHMILCRCGGCSCETSQ